MPDKEQASISGLCRCLLKAMRQRLVSFSMTCAHSLAKAYSGSILTAHAAAQQDLRSQAPRPAHQQGLRTLVSIILHLLKPHSLSLIKAQGLVWAISGSLLSAHAAAQQGLKFPFPRPVQCSDLLQIAHVSMQTAALRGLLRAVHVHLRTAAQRT